MWYKGDRQVWVYGIDIRVHGATASGSRKRRPIRMIAPRTKTDRQRRRLDALLNEISFPPLLSITSTDEVADYFQKIRTAGLYVLLFKSGEVYVGQSVQ